MTKVTGDALDNTLSFTAPSPTSAASGGNIVMALSQVNYLTSTVSQIVQNVNGIEDRLQARNELA